MIEPWVTVIVIVSALIIPGTYILLLGVRELYSARRVETMESIPINQVHHHSNPVVIEGTAISSSNTLSAPFTGKDCLAYNYETHEKIDIRNSFKSSKSGYRRTEDEWIVLDDGDAAVGFFIEDKTGRIYVDPSNAKLEFDTETYNPSPWSEIPTPLTEYIKSKDIIDWEDINSFIPWLRTPARRFLEGRLEPGQTVYVRGSIQSASKMNINSVDTVHSTENGISAVIIADTSQKGLSWRNTKKGFLYIGMSLVFFLILFVFIVSNI